MLHQTMAKRSGMRVTVPVATRNGGRFVYKKCVANMPCKVLCTGRVGPSADWFPADFTAALPSPKYTISLHTGTAVYSTTMFVLM